MKWINGKHILTNNEMNQWKTHINQQWNESMENDSKLLQYFKLSDQQQIQNYCNTAMAGREAIHYEHCSFLLKNRWTSSSIIFFMIGKHINQQWNESMEASSSSGNFCSAPTWSHHTTELSQPQHLSFHNITEPLQPLHLSFHNITEPLQPLHLSFHNITEPLQPLHLSFHNITETLQPLHLSFHNTTAITTPTSVIPQHNRDVTTPTSVIPQHNRAVTTPTSVIPQHNRAVTTPTSVIPLHNRTITITTSTSVIPQHKRAITTPTSVIPLHNSHYNHPTTQHSHYNFCICHHTTQPNHHKPLHMLSHHTTEPSQTSTSIIPPHNRCRR